MIWSWWFDLADAYSGSNDDGGVDNDGGADTYGGYDANCGDGDSKADFGDD